MTSTHERHPWHNAELTNANHPETEVSTPALQFILYALKELTELSAPG